MNKFQVLNLGVMGFQTPAEVKMLRRFGVTLQPDLVLICYFLNDAGAGSTYEYLNLAEPTEGLPLWRRISRLADRVAVHFEQRASVASLVRHYQDSYVKDAPGWLKAQEAIKDALTLSEEHGFKLVVVIFPVLWQLSQGYPFLQIHETVRGFVEDLGIPFMDLLPVFKDFDGPELWVHPNNQHPNEQAHALVGEALHGFLVDRGIVPVDG
jgi:hypothetical protein